MQTRSFRTIDTNGVRLRAVVEGAGPLVILLHGWPQCWYLWRQQIDPLVQAGYRVVVPDQRGYGASECPQPIEGYDIIHLSSDVVGIADALGYEDFLLVGHDWGAIVGWHVALLHPERVRSIVALSVPYSRWDTNVMTRQEPHGDNFWYSVYFQTPGVAEAELDVDPERSLRRIYFSVCAQAPDGLWFRPRPKSSKLLDGLLDFDTLPAWLTRADLDYYVAQFQRSGFRGPINYYRNIERNALLTPQLETAKVQQPSLFMIGNQDPARSFFDGQWVDAMNDYVADLRGKVFVEDCGHWLPIEQPAAVTRGILEFFGAQR